MAPKLKKPGLKPQKARPNVACLPAWSPRKRYAEMRRTDQKATKRKIGGLWAGL
jgi:hypothetical protein